MTNVCLFVLYTSFAQCYINTADKGFCGPRVKDFRTIYMIRDCYMSQKEELWDILSNVDLKHRCIKGKNDDGIISD